LIKTVVNALTTTSLHQRLAHLTDNKTDRLTTSCNQLRHHSILLLLMMMMMTFTQSTLSDAFMVLVY